MLTFKEAFKSAPTVFTSMKLGSCFLCCSVPGYGYEAGPALQPGKPLRDPEAALHWLPGCPWQPGDYTPSWKP